MIRHDFTRESGLAVKVNRGASARRHSIANNLTCQDDEDEDEDEEEDREEEGDEKEEEEDMDEGGVDKYYLG